MNNTIQNKKQNKKDKVFSDYEIFPGKVYLIKDDGERILINRDEAIELAKSEGKNLVQVAYNKNDYIHSVCKIMNLGKLKYENKKKEKEQLRKAKIANAEAKEIDFTIRIDTGDKLNKINKIKSILVDDRCRVKVCIRLSRRESNLMWMAKDLMKEITAAITTVSEIDQSLSITGGTLACTFRPIKK